MIKSVTLITTSHLSSNPRLVKEAMALLEAGYKLHILCAQHISELAAFDEELFQNLKEGQISIINYQYKGIKPKYLRIKSSIRAKLGVFDRLNFIPSLKWIGKSRMLPEMKRALKSIKTDLYIGHTLAALPAAAWAANYHCSNYAFDAEDFHRGETNLLKMQLQVKELEDAYLPDCQYLSTASPLITSAYQQLYPDLNIFTINNVFPLKVYPIHQALPSKPLKLVWFSQNIGLNRGLQQFIEGISSLNPEGYELHLRGTHTPEIKDKLLNLLSAEWQAKVFFYPQCSPIFLESWLSHFDIGLALENKDNLNRKICISNKIFQYMAAGMAVIATATDGQKWVFSQAPGIGLITGQDKMEIVADQISYWAGHLPELQFTKNTALNAAKSRFNWDLEKNKLLNQISTL